MTINKFSSYLCTKPNELRSTRTYFFLYKYRKSGNIAAKAENYIGSTKWSFASKRRTGMNTDKDYIFVAEIIEWAGASVPHR